jgi:hypothetical protein
MAKRPRTTTRSYTLKLLAPSDSADWLPLWDRLFRTHYSTCQGAKEFGEFFLNLRGGLPPTLADVADDTAGATGRDLQRGTRRILALGWLSVEDDRGAGTHQYRVSQVTPGQSLSRELAERLLRSILTAKGVTSTGEQLEWVEDCLSSLTATIRPDAAWVNRAAAFAAWQNEVGPDGVNMPEQARGILFRMCNDDFATLALPVETTVTTEGSEQESNDDADGSEDGRDDDEAGAGKSKAEPSNMSRRVYCDLFGGDPGPKREKEARKRRIAAILYEFLRPFNSSKRKPLPPKAASRNKLPIMGWCCAA